MTLSSTTAFISTMARSADAGETNAGASKKEKLQVGMVVFEGFELLDVYGPLEMFSLLPQSPDIIMIGDHEGTVNSDAGPAVVINKTFATVGQLDVLMIPGGTGTRTMVNDEDFLNAYKSLCDKTPNVASICTGAALLARTGLLDGLKATTNKKAWQWATSQGPHVHWIPKARWVEDKKYFTSAGVSAGTDMALALIQKLFGHHVAIEVADLAEYEWNSNPHHDPFAKLNGLVH